MKHSIAILFFLFSTGLLIAQNTVSFEVKEKSGEPLIGATLRIEGTAFGTVTNKEGNAKLENLPNGEIEFIISFVGYEEKKYHYSFRKTTIKL